ncbi:MAG: hypothetical protein GEU97_01255 [Actinophytocola sp.]|nr:hypothetical protein [Actinophytocola sp.]
MEQRHLGTRSSKEDRETFAATVNDATEHIGLRRRSLLGRSMAAGVGAFGITAGVVGLSGFVRDPWDGVRADRTSAARR